METFAILLSVTAAAMLLVLVGRLFWLVLKIAIVLLALWLIWTRVPLFKTPQPTTNRGGSAVVRCIPDAANQAASFA